MRIGEFEIMEPMNQTLPARICIHHESGEGGDFLKEEFDAKVGKAIKEFYDENF